jgi:hypothetical protein
MNRQRACQRAHRPHRHSHRLHHREQSRRHIVRSTHLRRPTMHRRRMNSGRFVTPERTPHMIRLLREACWTNSRAPERGDLRRGGESGGTT